AMLLSIMSRTSWEFMWTAFVGFRGQAELGRTRLWFDLGYSFRVMMTGGDLTPVGRLAPSPTGAQHVGNARTYLLAWLSIRSRGGSVILRMEDIDSPRVKRGAAAEAIEDLRWLGLDWDEGPDVGGPHAPYVQAERLELY